MALAILGFATSRSTTQLVLWRVAMGAAAASAFVALAACLARWFPPKERGLSQAVYSGLGGGFGDGMAFLFAPILLHFSKTSSWRTASMIMSVAVLLVAVLCAALLRSSPSHLEEYHRDERWKTAHELPLAKRAPAVLRATSSDGHSESGPKCTAPGYAESPNGPESLDTEPLVPEPARVPSP